MHGHAGARRRKRPQTTISHGKSSAASHPLRMREALGSTHMELGVAVAHMANWKTLAYHNLSCRHPLLLAQMKQKIMLSSLASFYDLSRRPNQPAGLPGKPKAWPQRKEGGDMEGRTVKTDLWAQSSENKNTTRQPNQPGNPKARQKVKGAMKRINLGDAREQKSSTRKEKHEGRKHGHTWDT